MQSPVLGRLAAALLAAALVLFAFPGATADREARLAALDAGSLARAEVAEGVSLADRVLELARETEAGLELDLGEVRFTGSPVELDAATRRSLVTGLRAAADGASLAVNGEREPVAGAPSFTLERADSGLTLAASLPGGGAPLVARQAWTPPDRTSLIPPILAISLAIALRRPLLSLLCGVLAGAVLAQLRQGAGAGGAFFQGLLDVPTVYFSNRIWNPDDGLNNVYIVVFVVLMLAMVGNLTLNGGIQGLMNSLRKAAKGPRSTQATAYGMGLAVFFDDYANTVLVGSTMRPLADRFRVSREKLAYIVDSTAAPVAGLSVVSTWIAFEVSTFSAQLPAAGLTPGDGYAVFLQTLPYRYYCWLALALVLLVVVTGRDFGPMRRAEVRARETGAVLAPGTQPMVSERATTMEIAPGVEPKAWRALVPLALFVGVTLLEIARGGGAFEMSLAELLTLEGVTGVLYDGSGNWPLMIGSGAGFLAASCATLSAGLGLRSVMRASWTTLRSMSVALGMLYLAWMIGDVCGALGTASFLTSLIQGTIDPSLLPVLLFVLAGFIAFSTGGSWGTMSILLPLVVPLAFQLGESLPIAGMGLMLLCIGAVLEGAIFGDHCSPISDTTVLSSISCASDHLDHVRTQAPYAALTAAVALGVGYVPAAFLGWSPGATLAACLGVLVAAFLILSRRIPDPD
jgi:Na+/H+ antiporter NhaC